jgi:type III secretory pathway component EscV
VSGQGSTGATRVLLSFSGAYTDLARRIGNDLAAASIEVLYDKWYGGGGVPARQSVAGGADNATFVLPLLTPSDATTTWIGDEWRRRVYVSAGARGVPVLPVRGEGDLSAIPEFLRNRSFADLRDRDYASELRRLIGTIRNLSGDSRIKLPEGGPEADDSRSAMSLAANPLVLELGKTLAPLFERDERAALFVDEMVPMMYEGLFYELGVQFPRLCRQVGSEVPPSSVRIVINGIPDTEVEVRPASILVNESVDAMAELGISAEPAVNPATGAACAWIPTRETAAAVNRGLTTWDVYEFLILVLSSVLRRKAADFIGIDQTRLMLQQIEPAFPQLVAESVPKTVSLFLLTDVLRRLVAELVSIRNMRQILMALVDWGRVEYDPVVLTEYVRAALQRQITHQLSRGTKQLVVFLLDPKIENTIRTSTRHTATGSYVDLEPSRLGKILDAIREGWDALPDGVQVPQIMTTMEIRASVRRLVALSMPLLHAVSYQELTPDTTIQPIGRISLDGFWPRAGVSVGGVPLWADRSGKGL